MYIEYISVGNSNQNTKQQQCCVSHLMSVLLSYTKSQKTSTSEVMAVKMTAELVASFACTTVALATTKTQLNCDTVFATAVDKLRLH